MLRRLRAAGEAKNIFSRKILSARQISCAIGDSLRSKVLAAGWDSRIRKLEIGSLEPSSIVTSSINFPVPKKSIARRAPRLEALIYEIRGQRVMLDSDLAKFYGVPTSRFNEVITRNRERLSFIAGAKPLRDCLCLDHKHEHEHEFVIRASSFARLILTSHPLPLRAPCSLPLAPCSSLRSRLFQLHQARHEFVVRVTKRFEEQQIKERD